MNKIKMTGMTRHFYYQKFDITRGIIFPPHAQPPSNGSQQA
jgi:hypothetical protein